MKPTKCTNFSNLFWHETACFGQFLCPSSGVCHCTHSNGIRHTGFADIFRAGSLILLESYQQTCTTCTITVCTVKNSWWWTK